MLCFAVLDSGGNVLELNYFVRAEESIILSRCTVSRLLGSS